MAEMLLSTTDCERCVVVKELRLKNVILQSVLPLPDH